MSKTLDYSDSPDARRRWLVAGVHVAALAFPLLVPGAVYAAYLRYTVDVFCEKCCE
jgi:hypothetical protein